MNKKFSLKLVSFLSLMAISCTSKQEVEEAPLIESEVVDQELAEIDGSPSKDETDAGFGGETLSNAGEALGEVAPSETLSSPETSSDQIFSASGVGNDPLSPADSPSSNSNAAVDTAESQASESKPEASVAPLTKIETTPFKRGGFLINAVYIARPGDDFQRVAQKIYGSKSRAKDLKAMNPGVTTIKVGTKIYYNSPNRPNDEMSLKIYYEDIGINPQTYVSQKEENLRTKSKELLGFEGAWKEIWSTNQSLVSKTKLPAGTEVSYWPDEKTVTAPSPTLAANSKANEAEKAPEPVTPDEILDSSNAVAINDVPPPPPVEPSTPPPPPPQPVEAFDPLPPPPPPPPPPAFEPPAQASMEGDSSEDQDDMMMILGAIGILSAGGAALIVIRKRKQQREAMAMAAMDSTNVGVVNK